MSNPTRKDPNSVSVAKASADAFFLEVVAQQRVWAIKDADGFPTATSSQGTAMPFWSSRSGAEFIIASVSDYAHFEPVELVLERFIERWLPGLKRDGLRVGLNCSGECALGYDYPPDEVLVRLQDHLSKKDQNA